MRGSLGGRGGLGKALPYVVDPTPEGADVTATDAAARGHRDVPCCWTSLGRCSYKGVRGGIRGVRLKIENKPAEISFLLVLQ